jgi:hypothetical protein
MAALKRDVIVWREALSEAILCIPGPIRGEVLHELAERQKQAEAQAGQLRVWTIADMRAEADHENEEWNAGQDAGMPPPRDARIAEAVAIMVQVLVRAIINRHSKKRAAEILFRQHRHGAGSGWLPDYLDGLPGIRIDRSVAARLANPEAPQS